MEVQQPQSSAPCLLPQLQKGPVQLPAFSLSPHLSDRQQASSVNLKPSELRLSQPSELHLPTAEEPVSLQPHDPQPAPRGILKKGSSSVGSEWTQAEEAVPPGQQQNGRGCEGTGTELGTQQQEVPVAPPRRERRQATASEGGPRSAAPWRQRARARRETIACCMPARVSSGQEAPQEESDAWRRSEELQLSTGDKESRETSGRVQ